MTLSWPIATLRPRQITRHIAARTTAGTTAASGFTQRVSVPAHAWTFKYEGILLATPAEIRAWDALAAQLDGAANAILVPLVEGEREQPAVPFTDDTAFSDLTGFEDLGGLVAATVGAAAIGATTIIIHSDNTRLQTLPGRHFTLGERLYRIITADEAGFSGDYTIEIRPPLRDAWSDGAAVDFNTLLCKCRLADDNQMMLAIDPAGMGTGAVNFIEDPS